MKNTILFLLLAVATSCTMMDDDYTRIESPFKPYVREFVIEAQARGIAIDTTYLKVTFVDDLSDNAQGRTLYDTHEILIKRGSYGWVNSPTTLVFHELGHLYLNRAHDNEIVNDMVKSIMSSDYDPDFDHPQNAHLKTYYVDELFNPETVMPEWPAAQDTTTSLPVGPPGNPVDIIIFHN